MGWDTLNNGYHNGTKWSPILSVIIQVINKIWQNNAKRESDLLITDRKELDNTKSWYQLIKTMTKFEKETRHWSYFFIKKQQLTRQNARQQRALMMCLLTQAWVLTVQLLAWCIHCPIRAQIGLVITNSFQEVFLQFWLNVQLC